MSITKDIEFDQRKKVFEEIKQFSRPEQEELYRIIRREGEEVSENRNGIFFDIMNLKKSTVLKIEEWIVFCLKNRVSFEEREKEMIDLLEANPSARGEA